MAAPGFDIRISTCFVYRISHEIFIICMYTYFCATLIIAILSMLQQVIILYSFSPANYYVSIPLTTW